MTGGTEGGDDAPARGGDRDASPDRVLAVPCEGDDLLALFALDTGARLGEVPVAHRFVTLPADDVAAVLTGPLVGVRTVARSVAGVPLLAVDQAVLLALGTVPLLGVTHR